MSSIADEFSRMQRMNDEMLRQQAKTDASIQKNLEHRKKVDDAMVQTAEELRKMREDLERIERKNDESSKAQAKDTQKAYNVSLIAIGLNALAIIVAVLIAFLS